MAVLNETDIYQFSVHGTAGAQEVTNVMHYRVTRDNPNEPLDPTTATTNALLLMLRTQWRAPAGGPLAVLHASYKVVMYQLRSIIGRLPAPAPNTFKPNWGVLEQIGGNGTDDVGTGAGVADDNFTTASVRKLTGLAGKGNKGGLHLSPLPQTTMGGNELSAAAQAAARVAGEAMFTPRNLGLLTNANIRPVVFNMAKLRFGPNVVNPVQWANDITVVTCNLYLGSQLSRKVRRPYGA